MGSNPFSAGWGSTEEGGEKSSVLLQVQLPVIANDECEESYKKDHVYDIQFDDRVLCAGFLEGGKDACQGDSGGPLMLPVYEHGTFPFYQIGIISWYKHFIYFLRISNKDG